MILILSDRHDRHADRVLEHLVQDKASFFRLNLDVESLKETKLTSNGTLWSIESSNGRLSSSEVECVWLRRPFVELTLEEQNDQSLDFKMWRNEWNKTLPGFYLALGDIPWLNPIREAYKAENKYLQRMIASKIGLKMPEMLTSNNKKDLIQFACKYDNVVMKLMSQEFYETTDGIYKGVYVNIISTDDLATHFGEVSENPITLQNYISKAYEVRYTVVGEQHLVCKIESQSSDVAKIDWRRYDIPHTPHSRLQPPDDIRNRVCELMGKLGLTYGAMDFIVTEEDEWYFLEINSMGQWLWIEDLTGLPISCAIANWLKRDKGGDIQ